MGNGFFEEQREQSLIKSRIVSKYFSAWANVILDLNNIQWVIVGGESGPQARPMSIQWVREIHNQSIAKDIPFFFKQWGTYGPDGVKRSKKANGKSIDGRIIQMFPDA